MSEEVLDDLLKFGSTQKKLFVLCGGGWSIAMGVVTSIAILINEIHDDWDLSYSVLSALPTCNMVGIFIGSNFWGTISDKIGRMIAFKTALFFSAVGCTISIFAVDIYMLSACFVLVGFGLAGSLSVDGAVFLEYTPIHKAHLLTGMSVVCASGGMYATGFAWMFKALDVRATWRYLMGVNAIFNFLVVIPRYWIKETPMFLISKGRYQEAEVVLKTLSKHENINSYLIYNSPKVENLTIKRQIAVLFEKPLKKLTILYLFIWAFTAFTFSGIGSYLPEILQRAGEGDSSNEEIYQSMFIQNLSKTYVGGVPAVIVATYLVKSFLGRKWTQTFSLCMGSVMLFSFLIPNYTGVRTIQLIACSTIYFFFMNILYPVQYAITPETFPIQVRNTAVGLCNCLNNIASILGPLCSSLLIENIDGILIPLIVFSFSLFIAAACSSFVIETKGFDPSDFNINCRNKSIK